MKKEITMNKLVRNLALAGVVIGSALVAQAAEFKGVLLDVNGGEASEVRITGEGLMQGGLIAAEAYTREEAMKPENQKAGYGIYTEDNKWIPFDEAGSKKALAALQQMKSMKKDDNMWVSVTGDVKDGKMRVTAIQVMP